MIDSVGQLAEELVHRRGITSVKRCRAEGPEFVPGAVEALGIPRGEDQFVPRITRSASCFQADAPAAADHDDNLPLQCRPVPQGRNAVSAHDFSVS
jgi:hypothetical protein